MHDALQAAQLRTADRVGGITRTHDDKSPPYHIISCGAWRGARCVQVVAEDSLDGMYHLMATMHRRGLAAQQLPNARKLVADMLQ